MNNGKHLKKESSSNTNTNKRITKVKNVSCYNLNKKVNDISINKSNDLKAVEISLNKNNVKLNESIKSIEHDFQNNKKIRSKGNSFITKLSKTVKMSKTDLPKIVIKDEKKTSFVNANNYIYKPTDDNKKNLFKKYSNNQIKGLFKSSPNKNKDNSKMKDKDMSKDQSTSLFNSFLSRNSSSIVKDEESQFINNFKNLFSKFGELCENLQNYKHENNINEYDSALFKKDDNELESNFDIIQKDFKITNIIDNIQLEANKFNLSNLKSSKVIHKIDKRESVKSNDITNLTVEENFIHNSSTNRMNNYKNLIQLVSNNYKSFEDTFKNYIRTSKNLEKTSSNQTNRYSVNFNFNFSSVNNKNEYRTEEIKYISKESNFSLINQGNSVTIDNLNNLKVFKNSSFVIGESLEFTPKTNKYENKNNLLVKGKEFQNLEFTNCGSTDKCKALDNSKLLVNLSNNFDISSTPVKNTKSDNSNMKLNIEKEGHVILIKDDKVNKISISNENNYFSSGEESNSKSKSNLKSYSKTNSEEESDSDYESEEYSYSDSSIDENVPQVSLPNLKSSKKMGFKLVPNNINNINITGINENLKSKKSKSNFNSKNLLSTRKKKKNDEEALKSTNTKEIMKIMKNDKDNNKDKDKEMYFKEELIHNDQLVFAEYYLEEKFTTRTKINQTKKSHFESGKIKPKIVLEENLNDVK